MAGSHAAGNGAHLHPVPGAPKPCSAAMWWRFVAAIRCFVSCRQMSGTAVADGGGERLVTGWFGTVSMWIPAAF